MKVNLYNEVSYKSFSDEMKNQFLYMVLYCDLGSRLSLGVKTQNLLVPTLSVCNTAVSQICTVHLFDVWHNVTEN